MMHRRRAYSIPIVNAETGERRHVLAELTLEQIWDCQRHWETRGPTGCGGFDGPLSKGLALRQARPKIPKGFIADHTTIERIRIVASQPDRPSNAEYFACNLPG